MLTNLSLTDVKCFALNSDTSGMRDISNTLEMFENTDVGDMINIELLFDGKIFPKEIKLSYQHVLNAFFNTQWCNKPIHFFFMSQDSSE